MTPDEDRAFYVALSMAPDIGPGRMHRLLRHFGTMGAAWSASPAAWRDAGLEPAVAANLERARGKIDPTKELARLAKAQIEALTWADAAFPPLLRQIPSPPICLYVRGSVAASDALGVAIVGTRNATSYGRSVTRRLATDLAANGVTVVSGLARGIDAVAHRAALESGGRTLAVFGCGLDIIYPAEHRRLAEEIAVQGALISEYPLGRQPAADQFPVRNRLISGLSLGVVITESRERSGALITAEFAGQQGRDVFAVPGSIMTRSSAGPHRLIQDGAKLVMNVEDILGELNIHMTGRQAELATAIPMSAEEGRIFEVLDGDPVHVDEISAQTAIPVQEVSSLLTLMEVRGVVHAVGALTYARGRQRD
ncbi:MAG: DNA-processing protein DprA [Chloroflexi bacterium]|nr:DNA-processing protein DprA [Chloroflexota bacterium]